MGRELNKSEFLVSNSGEETKIILALAGWLSKLEGCSPYSKRLGVQYPLRERKGGK